MSNRLIHETSPYLLQHAHNPVDWYPWGDEAFRRARAEDKPILLSVGYSACHWCHVMERESFEHVDTAALMNNDFINIKVDREERPDVDAIYMAAVQAMTRHGGWPMTVFLTPDGAPFYGGTYFPPEPRHGLPSFSQILQSVAEAYRTRRDEVLHSGETLREHLNSVMQMQIPRVTVAPTLFRQSVQALMKGFDQRFGGYGHAPKFPQVMTLEAVLRAWRRSNDAAALHQVEHTLTMMANGGIYDHVGGGFARYSVDAYWLVPHFEKMLYDNALLARIYLEAFQATAKPFYRRVATETLDYILRDMTSPQGGFYAAEDADSEGEEGKFYVWSPAEIRAALDVNDAELALRYWAVTDEGNFEGQTILSTPTPLTELASQFNSTPETLWERIVAIRETLLLERAKRIRPGRDEKILAAWNGLMLRSLAFAAAVLGHDAYRQAAEANARFILDHLMLDGRLFRSFKDGKAKYRGYLEDYACVADGLLALYETTFDRQWLDAATHLVDVAIAHFWDAERQTFFDTASDHEELLLRPRDVYDNATPSGTSVMVDVLLRLALLLERLDYRQYADEVLADLSGGMAQLPSAFGRLLAALDFATGEPFEVALIGTPEAADSQALACAVWSIYVPNKVVAGASPDDAAAQAAIPLLAERPLRDGKATAYVCVRHACQAPTSDPAEVIAQLGGSHAA